MIPPFYGVDLFGCNRGPNDDAPPCPPDEIQPGPCYLYDPCNRNRPETGAAGWPSNGIFSQSGCLRVSKYFDSLGHLRGFKLRGELDIMMGKIWSYFDGPAIDTWDIQGIIGFNDCSYDYCDGPQSHRNFTYDELLGYRAYTAQYTRSNPYPCNDSSLFQLLGHCTIEVQITPPHEHLPTEYSQEFADLARLNPEWWRSDVRLNFYNAIASGLAASAPTWPFDLDCPSNPNADNHCQFAFGPEYFAWGTANQRMLDGNFINMPFDGDIGFGLHWSDTVETYSSCEAIATVALPADEFGDCCIAYCGEPPAPHLTFSVYGYAFYYCGDNSIGCNIGRTTYSSTRDAVGLTIDLWSIP